MNAAIKVLALGACTTALGNGQTAGQAFPRDPRAEAACDAESRRAWNSSSGVGYMNPDRWSGWSIERDLQQMRYRQCLQKAVEAP
jgi:hypothetical protein